MAKIEKRMQKQIEAYENDLISAADLKMARERIEKERAKVEEHLQALKNRTVDTQSLRNQIEKQLKDISSTDRLKTKKSMAMLIDSIIVEAPNVQIVWRI
jgi:site-specific DNA recombinase